MTRIWMLTVIASLLLGASVAGAQEPPPPGQPPLPADADYDGFSDASDQCPTVRGTINGCPDTDSDGDGFGDHTDPCPGVSGLIDGCFTPAAPVSTEPVLQTATSVTAGAVSLRPTSRGARNGPLALTGTAFLGAPEMSVFTPRRLTIWLPKTVTVSGAPAKPCSESLARRLTLDNNERCAKILAGRLGGDDITAWFAYAGPKQGAKQRLWLRGRRSDDLVGFGTGWIERAKGAYKLTVELGELGVTTRGLEVASAPERSTAGRVTPLRGTCAGSLKMKIETAQGAATKTFRC